MSAMSLEAEKEALKKELKAIVLSNRSMSVEKLADDYKEFNGRPVPYRKLGFKSFVEFLQNSMADSFVAEEEDGMVMLHPIADENLAHLEKLIFQQRRITSGPLSDKSKVIHSKSNRLLQQRPGPDRALPGRKYLSGRSTSVTAVSSSSSSQSHNNRPPPMPLFPIGVPMTLPNPPPPMIPFAFPYPFGPPMPQIRLLQEMYATRNPMLDELPTVSVDYDSLFSGNPAFGNWASWNSSLPLQEPPAKELEQPKPTAGFKENRLPSIPPSSTSKKACNFVDLNPQTENVSPVFEEETTAINDLEPVSVSSHQETAEATLTQKEMEVEIGLTENESSLVFGEDLITLNTLPSPPTRQFSPHVRRRLKELCIQMFGLTGDDGMSLADFDRPITAVILEEGQGPLFFANDGVRNGSFSVLDTYLSDLVELQVRKHPTRLLMMPKESLQKIIAISNVIGCDDATSLLNVKRALDIIGSKEAIEFIQSHCDLFEIKVDSLQGGLMVHRRKNRSQSLQTSLI